MVTLNKRNRYYLLSVVIASFALKYDSADDYYAMIEEDVTAKNDFRVTFLDINNKAVKEIKEAISNLYMLRTIIRKRSSFRSAYCELEILVPRGFKFTKNIFTDSVEASLMAREITSRKLIKVCNKLDRVNPYADIYHEELIETDSFRIKESQKDISTQLVRARKSVDLLVEIQNLFNSYHSIRAKGNQIENT